MNLARDKMGFNVNKNDIDRSYRVYQRVTSKPKPVIVKLCSHNTFKESVHEQLEKEAEGKRRINPRGSDQGHSVTPQENQQP